MSWRDIIQKLCIAAFLSGSLLFLAAPAFASAAPYWQSVYSYYDAGQYSAPAGSGWPIYHNIPYVAGNYRLIQAAYSDGNPLFSYADVYASNDTSNHTLFVDKLIALTTNTTYSQQLTQSGSLSNIPSGTAIVIDWACQDQQYFYTSYQPVCSSYDALGNCTSYAGGGGSTAVSTFYDYKSSVGTGFSTGGKPVGSVTLTPPPGQTSTYGVQCITYGLSYRDHYFYPSPYGSQYNSNYYYGTAIPSTPVMSFSVTAGPVNPTPTITITADGKYPPDPVTVGHQVVIKATFTPGPGDTLTKSAINDNQGHDWCGTGNTCNDNVNWTMPPIGTKSFTFDTSTLAPGTYIFTPSVQTGNYPGWNNYGKSLTLTVVAAQTCANGANNYPNCNTCTAPLTWNGSSCVAACTPSWQCTWSACSAGMQTCTGAIDYNSCGVSTGDPAGSTRSCVSPPPVITAFSSKPPRVHTKTATSVTFSWSGTNLPPAGCSVSGTSIAGASSPATASITIAQPTIYTLTCGSATAQTTIGLIPVFIEI